MKLFIKHMVSERCKLVVKQELDKLGLRYTSVDLAVAEIKGDVSDEIRSKLGANLEKVGLELIDDRTSILTEQVKSVVIDLIHNTDEAPKVNYSDYISKKLNYDYTYLSNLFTKVKGTTIQQFIIMNKIEKVKELLLYDELNLTEISYKLNYSSVAHLSNQFKKITGFSPSFYKQGQNNRNTLDSI